jgi:hypothetical protein
LASSGTPAVVPPGELMSKITCLIAYYIKNNFELIQQAVEKNPEFAMAFAEAKKNKTEENLKKVISFIEQELDKKIEDEKDPCNGGPKA